MEDASLDLVGRIFSLLAHPRVLLRPVAPLLCPSLVTCYGNQLRTEINNYSKLGNTYHLFVKDTVSASVDALDCSQIGTPYLGIIDF